MPTFTRVKQRTFRWNPSTDPTVVSQRIYIIRGDTFPADAEPVLDNVDMSVNQILIPQDVPNVDFEDGTYIVGVGSVDNVGNETVEYISVPFDFTAPVGATGLEVL